MGYGVLTPARPVYVVATGSVVGHEEYAGPFGDCFDLADEAEDRFGETTFEKAESRMQALALEMALSKIRFAPDEIDLLVAGDLLNQCVASGYGLMPFGVPFLGIYGACSTAAEGILLGSLLCGSDVRRCAAVTSSHNCSAERQFRYPLEYGGQRPPTAQWTATASGAFILSSEAADTERTGGSCRVRVTECLPGIVRDSGIGDIGNMGAAMAPAVAETYCRYAKLSRAGQPADYVVTGDLGFEGTGIFRDLCGAAGYPVADRHMDCGLLLYDRVGQDKHAGGSGCGCSAVLMASHFLRSMAAGGIRRLIFIGSGAMMNAMTVQQGGTIPAIGHLVVFEAEEKVIL